MTPALFRPPAPRPLGANLALLRSIVTGDRNLLALIPRQAYRQSVAPLGYSRRRIVLVNDPATIRRLMTQDAADFPKSDLMVASLSPLIHDGLFVSSGLTWARQRAMIDPAFSHMRVNRAFTAMEAAVADYETHLDGLAQKGGQISLERAMSHLTADIICRTIFSQKLDLAMAQDFFDAWATFQESVATINLTRLVLGRAWQDIPQPSRARKAASVIRSHLATLVDRRMMPDAPITGDIIGDLIAARDPESGSAFTRDEVVDQVGVFFLAGHETTASALTWCFFILSQQPDLIARMRAELDREIGSGVVDFAATKRLTLIRNVFRETLRLYPPLAFIPRVSEKATRIDGIAVPRGAMIMISPWIIHRHEALWHAPDRFDPDRFLPEQEKTQIPGSYIPFGLGPRICIGAAFALVEAALILARLIQRYDFTAEQTDHIHPVSHLATRPSGPIRMRVQIRNGM